MLFDYLALTLEHNMIDSLTSQCCFLKGKVYTLKSVQVTFVCNNRSELLSLYNLSFVALRAISPVTLKWSHLLMQKDFYPT
jgi:hypothetical protein